MFTLIEAHEARPLKLYVYNDDSYRCREVTIAPNGAWGGEGSIGCGIGHGCLHRIPTEDVPPRITAADVARMRANPNYERAVNLALQLG